MTTLWHFAMIAMYVGWFSVNHGDHYFNNFIRTQTQTQCVQNHNMAKGGSVYDRCGRWCDCRGGGKKPSKPLATLKKGRHKSRLNISKACERYSGVGEQLLRVCGYCVDDMERKRSTKKKPVPPPVPPHASATYALSHGNVNILSVVGPVEMCTKRGRD
jgi:hypothetical protein